MISNINLHLLCGGLYECGPHWNKQADELDDCYKFYFPISGNAECVADHTTHELRAGTAYFISGYRLNSQSCTERMDVYWLHCVPESLRLQHRLSRLPAVHSWSMDTLEWARDVYTHLDVAFRPNPKPRSQALADIPDYVQCKIHAMLLHLIGDLLAIHEVEDTADFSVYARLTKSIDYMDRNYLESPPLQDVAAQSHLAPNYFHRLFKNTFSISPFNYMLTRRMNLAKQLLSASGSTIREIAGACGYSSEFYFSKTFRKQFGVSPSTYRQQMARA